MKKIKLIVMSSALLLSIGGAVATRAANIDCTNVQNYYLSGSTYAPTGVFGHDYICQEGTVCTYVQQGNTYIMCRAGSYFPINQLKAKDAQQVKK